MGKTAFIWDKLGQACGPQAKGWPSVVISLSKSKKGFPCKLMVNHGNNLLEQLKSVTKTRCQCWWVHLLKVDPFLVFSQKSSVKEMTTILKTTSSERKNSSNRKCWLLHK